MLVHTGPFGNIAHGNSSVLADLIGIRTGDFLVTDAGFVADMGAERFFDSSARSPDKSRRRRDRRHRTGAEGHSGHHRVTAGRPLPDALLEEESRRGPRRRGEPAQADRERPAVRRPGGGALPVKIETIARRVCRADGVDYAPAALVDLERYAAIGRGHLPVCLAKTHQSISSATVNANP